MYLRPFGTSNPSRRPRVTGWFALLCWGLLQSSLVADDSKYFQFHPGDESTRDLEIISAEGQVKEKTVNHKTVAGQIESDGTSYLRLRTWTDGDSKVIEHAELLRRDERGLYVIDTGESNAAEQLTISFPLKVGAYWRVKSRNKSFITRIIGIETVAVAGRTFEDCYHFRTESMSGDSIEDFWEAPAVGTVKSEIVFRGGDTIRITLREFRPGALR